jgi:hypothetical protein
MDLHIVNFVIIWLIQGHVCIHFFCFFVWMSQVTAYSKCRVCKVWYVPTLRNCIASLLHFHMWSISAYIHNNTWTRGIYFHEIRWIPWHVHACVSVIIVSVHPSWPLATDWLPHGDGTTCQLNVASQEFEIDWSQLYCLLNCFTLSAPYVHKSLKCMYSKSAAVWPSIMLVLFSFVHLNESVQNVCSCVHLIF